MTVDPASNFGFGTVSVAPTTPTAGVTLTLNSGEGSKFPDPGVSGAFNIVIKPAGFRPLDSNAEIARCTARTGDVLTITRHQEGTSARTILVGDEVYTVWTKKSRDDVVADIAAAAAVGAAAQTTANSATTAAATADGKAVTAQGQVTTHAALTTAHGSNGAVVGLTDMTAAIAAAVAGLFQDWNASADTWVYVSATTFKITGADRTAIYVPGTKVRFKQGGSYKYFYIYGSTFSTDTTITIVADMDFTLSNAAITDNYYSYVTSPTGFPIFHRYQPTWVGFSSNPTGYFIYCAIPDKCDLTYQDGAGGTSSATNLTLTMPFASARSLANAGICFVKDNSVNQSTPGHFQMTAGSNVLSAFKTFYQGAWTNPGAKDVYFNPFSYEI